MVKPSNTSPTKMWLLSLYVLLIITASPNPVAGQVFFTNRFFDRRPIVASAPPPQQRPLANPGMAAGENAATGPLVPLGPRGRVFLSSSVPEADQECPR